MKFNSAFVVLSLPLTSLACDLTVRWTKNWIEDGLTRYQVKLITNPRNDEHLQIYAQAVQGYAGIEGGSNTQWYWDGPDCVVDVSFVQGPGGHEYAILPTLQIKVKNEC